MPLARRGRALLSRRGGRRMARRAGRCAAASRVELPGAIWLLLGPWRPRARDERCTLSGGCWQLRQERRAQELERCAWLAGKVGGCWSTKGIGCGASR